MYLKNRTSAAPIAIFAYNRRDRLEIMFESLRACDGFSESPITIFVDGPRDRTEVPRVTAVRDYVTSLELPNVRYQFAAANCGLRASIASGVSQICADAGRVIVLEDDLILCPSVLRYFNEALTKYADRECIWSVCAYMPEVVRLQTHDAALVLPTTHPWGWATWHRAWRTFDVNGPIDSRTLQSRAIRERLNMHGLRDYASMLSYALSGMIDSWFARWNYHVCVRNGLSVFPPRTLIQNAGLRAGTHSTNLNVFQWLASPPPLGGYDFSLPDDVAADLWAIDDIVQCRESHTKSMTFAPFHSMIA